MTIKTNMCNTNGDDREPKKNYKLLPPDGGWGYVVLLSLITYNVSTVIFLSSNAYNCLRRNVLEYERSLV